MLLQCVVAARPCRAWALCFCCSALVMVIPTTSVNNNEILRVELEPFNLGSNVYNGCDDDHGVASPWRCARKPWREQH